MTETALWKVRTANNSRVIAENDLDPVRVSSNERLCKESTTGKKPVDQGRRMPLLIFLILRGVEGGILKKDLEL